MVFEVSFGKARCEARYGVSDAAVSGEHRNAADESSKTTEGRVLFRSDSVATLIRCAASHCEPLLVRTENLPGQMIPYGRNML